MEEIKDEWMNEWTAAQYNWSNLLTGYSSWLVAGTEQTKEVFQPSITIFI